jgi:hypothetical protein
MVPSASQEQEEETMTATLAPAGTTCNPTGFRCVGNDGQASPAVHTVGGRHLCGFHSPYDVVEANGKTSMENYLARFDARQEEAAQNHVDGEFEEILVLEHATNEARTAIDLPAGHQAMQERPARVAAWKAARETLSRAVDALSDDRLRAFAEYRKQVR